MRSRRIMYALLLICLFVAEIYINTKLSLLLLCVGLFLPVASVVFCALSYKGLSIKLHVQDTTVKGETIEIKVILENDNALSIAGVGATLNVTNTLTGDCVDLPFESAVGGHKKTDCLLSLEGFGVGRLFFTVQNVKVFDVFRLVSFSMPLKYEASTIVFPREMDCTISEIETLEVDGESLRYSEEFSGNDPSEVFDIREYKDGDELRTVHWKLSGKLDKLMVKEFSRPLNYSVVLMPELIKSSETALEMCAEYTLNVSRALLEAGVMHSFIWYDGIAEELITLNITDIVVLENAMMRFLVSGFYENHFEALTRFMADNTRDRNSKLIYISPLVDKERIEKLSLMQPTKVVEIKEGKGLDWNLKF